MVLHRFCRVLPLLAFAAACADQPTQPEQPQPGPREAPKAVGVYTFTLSGIGGAEPSASVAPAGLGPSETMTPVTFSSLGFELISTSTFTEGTRGQGGHRYIAFTYRVRNGTGAPLTNLTFIPVTSASTISGTPFLGVKLFTGANAPASVPPTVVPTGAVAIGSDGRLKSLVADVLQVFTEAEVAAIALPAGYTGIFPYGFTVRNPATPSSRTLPVAASANDWSGMLTFAFRVPLQSPNSTADVFSITFDALAVQDSETRLTESIEERQDTAGIRRLRERATALGATTVTVLSGSEAMDPFETDYPGQRQICTVRTAGTAASPVTFITNPGAYTELEIYRSGESLNNCNAYYRAGTAAPGNYGLAYNVTVRAMDRYGNVKTSQVDTVALTSTDGTAVMPGPGALVSGAKTLASTYTTYGNSTLTATGRRLKGTYPMFVNGMTRTWTGNVDTNWLTNNDWAQLFQPGVQDSVIIPGDRPNFPLLVQNITTAGVTMTSGSTTQPFINLSSFDLTVNGSVDAGTTGTFTGTGRLILAGTAATVGGGLSNFDVRNMRVTGTYSATSNLNVTGGRIVVQGGRLRSTGFRVRVRPT